MSLQSLDSVIEYIALRHPDLQLERDRVEHFCKYVIRDYGRFDCFIPSREMITVSCGKAKLPCNLYKIVSLGGNCSTAIPSFYQNKAGDIVFHEQPDMNGTILVEMLLYPLDSDGRLLIEEEYVPACYWYSMSQIDLDPMMKGDLPERMFERAELNFYSEVARARGSMTNLTDNVFDKAVRSLHSWRTTRKPTRHR